MLIDLREIPEAHRGEEKDTFELFAREFLEAIGLSCVAGPDRGPDGGRDLLVEENRIGPLGTSTIRWLVSCKHKAHSDSSVGANDEEDPIGRMDAHRASGFICFYSTIPSSSLATKLSIVTDRKRELSVFDRGRIAKYFVEDDRLAGVLESYLPESASRLAESPSRAAHAKLRDDHRDFLQRIAENLDA